MDSSAILRQAYPHKNKTTERGYSGPLRALLQRSPDSVSSPNAVGAKRECFRKGGRLMNRLQKCLLLICAASMTAIAQEHSPNSMIRTWTEGTVSPAATIKDIQWLVGDWRGPLDGNMQQSVIFSPTKGHMPGFARSWAQDGTIGFYEINDFIEVNGSLEYHVKHFSGDLAAWEGKDGYQRHRLIALTDTAIYLDGITVVKEGRDHFTVYVLIKGDGEKDRVAVVHESRVQE